MKRATWQLARVNVRATPQSCARRWQFARAPIGRDARCFNDIGACGEDCRAPHHSNVQRNKPRWDAEDFTSMILSYSRVREFSLPARLADGKKKCVDVPRCDTASRALWRSPARLGRSPGRKKGKTPIPNLFGCEALPFTTACKRGKNLKMEEAQCAEAYSQVRWLRRLP